MKKTKLLIDPIKLSALKLFSDIKKDLIENGIVFLDESTFEYEDSDVCITQKIKEIFDKYYNILDDYNKYN